jgi:hypothetical protein
MVRFWTRKRKISKQKLDCCTYIVGELTLDICRILHLASQILSRIFFFSSKLNLTLLSCLIISKYFNTIYVQWKQLGFHNPRKHSFKYINLTTKITHK